MYDAESKAARGSMALEACNCIASSFVVGSLSSSFGLTLFILVTIIWSIIKMRGYMIKSSLPPSLSAPKIKSHLFFSSSFCFVLLWKLLCYICFLFFALRIFFFFIWQLSHGISQICSKLIETAKLCLGASDKYLQSTIKFLDKNLPNPMAAPSIAVWKTDGLVIC